MRLAGGDTEMAAAAAAAGLEWKEQNPQETCPAVADSKDF